MNKSLKLLILSFIGSSLIFFSGCKKTEELGQKFIDNSKKTYDSAATKVKDTYEVTAKKVNEVKDAAVEKANQVQDAAKKVKEAVDAVDKVTE